MAHVRLWDYSQEWGIIRPKFSFFIGMFYGVFIMDLCHSAQVVTKLKVFADENDVIIKYESLKSHIRAAQDQDAQKYHFFRPFQAAGGLHEYLQGRLKKMEDAVKENRDLVS